MSAKEMLSQRVARRLTAHAGSLLQQRRANWAQAMRSELEYVPQGLAALRWAVGCLFASYIERAENMMIGSLKTTRISRVALTLEMLLCFLQPTGGVLLAVISVVAIAGFSPGWGAPVSALLLSTSLVGPLGLFLAFKFIVLERPQMSKGVTLVFGVLAGWTFIGNTYFVLNFASPLSELRAIILMALLPVVGAAHLVYLASTERSELAPA
jgi:hypothetical protein